LNDLCTRAIATVKAERAEKLGLQGHSPLDWSPLEAIAQQQISMPGDGGQLLHLALIAGDYRPRRGNGFGDAPF
jgi:hypothetical protein